MHFSYLCADGKVRLATLELSCLLLKQSVLSGSNCIIKDIHLACLEVQHTQACSRDISTVLLADFMTLTNCLREHGTSAGSEMLKIVSSIGVKQPFSM